MRLWRGFFNIQKLITEATVIKALISAVIEGHEDILKLFLDDPRLEAVSVRHVFWWASRKGNADIMELLEALHVVGRLNDRGG